MGMSTDWQCRQKDYVNKMTGERVAEKRTHECPAATSSSSKNKQILVNI